MDIKYLYSYCFVLDMKCLATDTLFAHILEKLASIGYFVDCSFTQVDLEKHLIFKKHKPVHKTKFLCLNTKYHSVRLVNAPSEIVEVFLQFLSFAPLSVIKWRFPGSSMFFFVMNVDFKYR